MSGKHWTKKEEAFLVENADKPTDWLSNELDKSDTSIRHKLSRLGLTQDTKWQLAEDDVVRQYYGKIAADQWSNLLPNRKYKAIKDRACRLGLTRKRKKWTSKELDLLKSNYATMSNSELLELLSDKTESEIRNKAVKLGLSKPDFSWSSEEDDFLRSSYTKESQEFIQAGLPNRTWNAIIGRAVTLKVGSRRSAGLIRKYTFDFNFFDEIDTEEKAYWLGFIYADGSVALNPHRLRISLVVEGKRHLEKFKDAIGYTGKVLGPYHVSSKNKGGKKTKYTLECCHTGFVEALMKHGVIPNKTFLVSFPDIPKELRRHFIRGLFDGDGSVSVGTTKYRHKVYKTPTFSICGAVPKFLEDVVDVIVEEANVSKNTVIDRSKEEYDRELKNSTASLFSYSGTPALRIRDWLYEDSSVSMDCKKEKFYSWDYSSKRPQDKEHQTQIIDTEMERRGWKRLSEYKGYYGDMTIQCDKGHVWTTLVQNFKNECGCPRCCDIASGERMTEMGKDNLTEIFANRGWELLSEYSGEGEIQIRCEHGEVFTMKRRSAVRPHAQCDCVRTNCLDYGKQKLLQFLEDKGWELASEYAGFFEYVTVRCEHGKEFQRLPGNMKANSKCDCQKLAGSGHKGVYKQANGRWSARVGRQSVGTYDTIEEAAAAREHYLKEVA